MNPMEFQCVIKNVLAYIENHEAIVTIGIRPNRPETGYGYVEAKNAVDGEIHGVETFKRKPNFETTKQYLAAGNYLWNVGIFVFRNATMINAL